MGGVRVMVPYPLNVWEVIVVPHPPLQMSQLFCTMTDPAKIRTREENLAKRGYKEVEYQ